MACPTDAPNAKAAAVSMTDPSFPERFRRDASLLVQALDTARDRLLVAQMSEEDYRAASFLDQRIMAGRPCEWMGWDPLAAAGDGLPADAQFIFHIGHVGSTLISRLLGELPTVLALREPLLLRSLAGLCRLRNRPESPWSPEQLDQRVDTALGWLSRSFRPGQRAIIKVTSFANDFAPAALRQGVKALFLHVSPATYMETILAGENSVQELASLGASRLTRLHERVEAEPWRLWRLSIGERAALGWACEMATLDQAAAGADPADILWMDFDAFLADPADRLLEIAAHFGHPLDEAGAGALAAGPIMSRYSKAPEHGYTAQLRRDVLAQARGEWADELARGRRWVEDAAQDHPLIARALARSQG